MRVLGIDLGLRRIGVATGESAPRATSLRPAITASGTLKRDAESIAAVARREQADALVVGVPLGDEGEDEKVARAALKLADTLKAMGWTVHTANEAMTSVEAEANLRREGGTASVRRKLRDGEAARLIIERFFDEQDKA